MSGIVQHKVDAYASNRTVGEIVSALSDGRLKPDPKFQRRLIWANKHKIAFLQTVLEGYPFPEVFFATGEIDSKTAAAIEWVVDGQQRLTTLHQYFVGSRDLHLPAGIMPYAKLPEDQKRAFLSYKVVVRHLGDIPRYEIVETFKRINSTGYSLNSMELIKSQSEGAFIEFGILLANESFFRKPPVFSPLAIRRMRDLRFCLTLTITILSSYFDEDDEIDDYVERYKDDFDRQSDVLAELRTVFEFASSLRIPKPNRFWRPADLLSVLVESHRLMIREKRVIDVDRARESLIGLYHAVADLPNGWKDEGVLPDEFKTIASYARASIQGTSHRVNRITRGRIVYDLLAAASHEEDAKIAILT